MGVQPTPSVLHSMLTSEDDPRLWVQLIVCTEANVHTPAGAGDPTVMNGIGVPTLASVSDASARMLPAESATATRIRSLLVAGPGFCHTHFRTRPLKPVHSG